MTDAELQMAVKKAKRFNYIVFAVLILFIAAALVAYVVFRYEHTFTTEKWDADPDNRVKLVDSMMSRYDLLGMTEEELVSLLGEETYRKDKGLVYYLGAERGWISIDSEWLIITFDNKVVSDVTITTD